MNLRRLLLVGGALGCGGTLVAVLLPLMAVVVLLGGLGSSLAALNPLQGAHAALKAPPPATPLTHPVEWLPLVDGAGGVPNALAMAVMAAGSGGNVFGNTYFCSNGHTASTACATAYPAGALGIGGGVHTLGIGQGLMNIRDAATNPTINIPVGVHDLATALAGQYLMPGLTRFHATDQVPPGYHPTGHYAPRIGTAVYNEAIRGGGRGDTNVSASESAAREQTLQTYVRQILNAGPPQAIVLFGSSAREEAADDSDFDLLVIESRTHLPVAPMTVGPPDCGALHLFRY